MAMIDRHICLSGFLICVLNFATTAAFAAGVAVRTQSAHSLATSYASEGTGKDVSLIFSNPALVGSYDRHQLSLGLANLFPDIDFKDGARTIPTLDVDAGDPNTSVSGVTDSSSLVPTLAGVHPITDKINFGWTFTAPWGGGTDYGDTWVGRYHTTETNLTVLNLDLIGSYKLNDQWAFGFGVQVQQGDGTLASGSNGAVAATELGATTFTAALTSRLGGDSTAYDAITSGAAGGFAGLIKAAYEAQSPDETSSSAALAAASTAVTSVLTATDGTGDLYARYEGDNIAYGIVLGATYDPSPELRLGLSYRSTVKHETEGDIVLTSDNSTGQAVIAALGLSPNVATGGSLDLTLPDVILFGASYMLMPDLRLFGSLTYTLWSSFVELDLQYQDIVSNVLVKLDWENTLTLALGGQYQLNEMVDLKFGLAHDPSPATDALRTPRIPEDDIILVSFGAGYALDQWRVDAALSQSIISEPKINLDEDAYPESVGRGDLTGRYDAAITNFMIQLSYMI